MNYEASNCSTRTSSSFSSHSSTNLGSPLFTSSPTISRHRQPTPKKTLRILVINFQSIRAKRETFWALLEQVDPDIILASETWLNSSIFEREILPDNCVFVSRRDRTNSTYGEVAIIAKHDMEGTEILNSTTSEFIAASFNTSSTKKPIIIGCLYRPTDNNLDYTSNLCQEIRNLHSQYRNNIIWIGGDVNLPDIDWTTDTKIGHQYSIQINETFLLTQLMIPPVNNY
jgi:exonuclease III